MDTKTLLATVARTALKAAAGAAVAHGLINASGAETFVGAGMLLAGAAWSLWNDYGRAMTKDALDILRAKVANAAAAARKNQASAPDQLAKLDQHVTVTTKS